VVLGTTSAALVRISSGFVYPPFFDLFRALFFLQYTQGRSLLEQPKRREILALCENGFRVPLYRALVTDTYISRWAYRPRQYLFSGVQRRDGAPVAGNDWLAEVRAHLSEAAQMYEVLPDISQPARKFDQPLIFSANSDAPSLPAAFPFSARNLLGTEGHPPSVVSQAIPRHRIFRRRRPS
jgi:hypothetical protein